MNENFIGMDQASGKQFVTYTYKLGELSYVEIPPLKEWINEYSDKVTDMLIKSMGIPAVLFQPKHDPETFWDILSSPIASTYLSPESMQKMFAAETKRHNLNRGR